MLQGISIKKAVAVLALAALAIAPAIAGGQSEAAADEAEELMIMDPWIRASAPGDQMGAGYMVIHNRGTETARLVGVAGEVADRIELHTHTQVDGLMRMIEVESVEIAAGEQVAFEPGGFHVMFMGIADQFEAGDTHSLTLEFDGTDAMEVEFTVQPIDYSGEMDHDDMEMDSDE